MDEECEKVNLSALRQRFEKDTAARHVDKRQTVFEVSKSQFEAPVKSGAGNPDVVQHRLNEPPPPVTSRRCSEADMIIKPVVSTKPAWLPKKPNIDNAAQTGMPHNRVVVKPTAQKKGLGVVEKHANLFQQPGLSVAQSEGDIPVIKGPSKLTQSHPVLPKVGLTGGHVRDKPAVAPRTRILNSATCPELAGTPEEDDAISVQSKKKLFEKTDTKPNILSKPKSGDGEDQQVAFSTVLSKMKAAESDIFDRPRAISVPIGTSKMQTDRNIASPEAPPRKPTRTFAHDIYQHMQRMSALIPEQIEERPEEEVFGIVDFRTRGVIVGEEDVFIPRERLGTNISVNSTDSSYHEYEDVDSPKNLTPPRSPSCRPAFPLPSRGMSSAPVAPASRNFLSSDDYSILEHQRIRSWESGISSTKSQLSLRSNSDECLYSRTYEIAQPAEYIDPVDLFGMKPRAHVPGFPSVEIDEYGYAVPQHTQLKTPVFMSRSLDGVSPFIMFIVHC
jgi:hypothetical protein